MKRRTFLQTSLMAATAAGMDTAAQAAGTKRSYKLLPCEEAFQIPEILEQLRKKAGGVPSMSSGPIAGPFLPLLLDVGRHRIAAMDADGIDMQILSLVSPGVQVFDKALAMSLARLANDRLAAAVKAHPTRFAGLATFAPQDPAQAAKELQRAVTELKLNGALVNSHTGDEYLDDPKFWAIFEAAESLDIPLYIHPREPSAGLEKPLAMPGFTVGWGYAVETGTHALRLINGGVFDRFPKLKIILGHMGEGIPFFLDRIDNRYGFETGMFARKQPLKRLPGEYFRENFLVTTSGMNYAAPLQATIDTIGVDRVLFAIDYPFEDQPACVKAIEALALPDAEKKKICETNVRRAFKLPA